MGGHARRAPRSVDRRRHRHQPRRHPRGRHLLAARGRGRGLPRKADRHHDRRSRPSPEDRVPDTHAPVRRPQHAPYGRGAHAAPRHPGGAHRRGESDLVPPLRRQRRRLLLQRLARGSQPHDGPPPAKGSARHRRHELAVRLGAHPRRRNGRPDGLRGARGPQRPERRSGHGGLVLLRQLAARDADRFEPRYRRRRPLHAARAPGKRRHDLLRTVPLHPGLLA